MTATARASAPSSFVERAARVLGDARALPSLSPLDLVALALAIRPDALTTPARLATVLTGNGLHRAFEMEAVVETLSRAAAACPALTAGGDGTFALSNPSWIGPAAIEALARAERALLDRDEPLPPLPAAPRGRRPPVRGSGIEVRAPGSPTGLGRDGTRGPRARTGDSKRKAPAAGARGGKRRPAPPAASRSKAAPAPILPAAPEPSPPALCREGESAALLRELLGRCPSTLGAVRLALRGDAIASAQAFSELWSLSGLEGVESHAYQLETVRRVLRSFRGRALLADEVGLGKTIEAMLVLREYQLRGMVRRALILVPPSLVDHWRGELEDKAGLAVRTTGGAEFRKLGEEFWTAEGIVIASLALARSSRHADGVAAPSWDLVIVDEAHHLKNSRTLAWQLVNRLRSRFLLLLTATPVETDLGELYNLVSLIKPGQFPTPAAFRSRFVDPKNPTAPKNRDRLRALLAEVMVRNTRAQSGLKLPPRYVTTVVVDPAEAERQLYDAVVAVLRKHSSARSARLAASTLLLEAGSAPGPLAATLERIAASDRHDPAFRDDVRALLPLARELPATRKDEAVLDILRRSGEGALVFTRFVRTATHLARHLADAGIGCSLYHGGLGAEQKAAALEAFRAGGRCLVATDVGGEGQNLQFCHVLINYDLPYNPMQIEQRIGRLHRMGQTEAVRVFNLCARGTAEERLLDVLDRRLNLFELVVGEMDMILGNLADERDLEERILSLYAESKTDEELASGFDAIAGELASARSRYEKVKALDEALFRTDYEA